MLSTEKGYRDVRVVVTGAAGFVGRWVCRLLWAAGADLRPVDRDPAALEAVRRDYGIGGEPVIAHLEDDASIRELLERHRPAVVFNLAGYGVRPGERDERLLARVNADLPASIARLIVAVAPADPWPGLRLVHAGSAFEYGLLQGPIDERSEPQPNTAYGRAKLLGTRRIAQACDEAGLRACTARLATVYGPGEMPPRLLPSLMVAARSGEPVELTDGRQLRDFTYVEDVARGLLRIGLLPVVDGGILNLSTGKLGSVRSFVESAGKVLGIGPDKLRFGALPQRADEVHQGRLEVGRLRDLVGWVPSTSVSEGVRETWEFLA